MCRHSQNDGWFLFPQSLPSLLRSNSLPGFLPGIVPDFARAFSPISQNELFGARYPVAWYIVKRLFTSVLVKSGRYLFRSSANIRKYPPVFTSTSGQDCVTRWDSVAWPPCLTPLPSKDSKWRTSGKMLMGIFWMEHRFWRLPWSLKVWNICLE